MKIQNTLQLVAVCKFWATSGRGESPIWTLYLSTLERQLDFDIARLSTNPKEDEFAVVENHDIIISQVVLVTQQWLNTPNGMHTNTIGITLAVILYTRTHLIHMQLQRTEYNIFNQN